MHPPLAEIQKTTPQTVAKRHHEYGSKEKRKKEGGRAAQPRCHAAWEIRRAALRRVALLV
jgi:hypothetical protein